MEDKNNYKNMAYSFKISGSELRSRLWGICRDRAKYLLKKGGDEHKLGWEIISMTDPVGFIQEQTGIKSAYHFIHGDTAAQIEESFRFYVNSIGREILNDESEQL